jgi:hypothetical protein
VIYQSQTILRWKRRPRLPPARRLLHQSYVPPVEFLTLPRQRVFCHTSTAALGEPACGGQGGVIGAAVDAVVVAPVAEINGRRGAG